MRSWFLAALAVVAGATVAPAHAEIYDNKSLPLYLETPAGFTIRPVTVAGQDLALQINPVGSFPGRVAGEPYLCQLGFRAAPKAETQEWFNARMKDEALLAQARQPISEVLTLRSETAFNLGDAVGREYVGLSRDNPKAVVVLSILTNPRGGLLMSCLLRAEQADAALPVVRSIRDTIRPPK
jgi:hypothetical protein